MEKYIETNWVTSVWGIFLCFPILIFPAIPLYRTIFVYTVPF